MKILTKIILVLVICVVAIITLGCGFCGAMGLISTVTGGAGQGYTPVIVVLSLVGIAAAVGGVFAIRALVKAISRADND